MDNRADAGNIILKEVQDLKGMKEKVIGEYLGFDLAILKDALGAKKIALKGESDYDTEISTSPVGLIVRLENLFEGIPEKETFWKRRYRIMKEIWKVPKNSMKDHLNMKKN